MRRIKGLLLVSIMASTMIGVSAYPQNARVTRSENLQKSENTKNKTERRGNTSNAPLSQPSGNDRVNNAHRPGFTENRPNRPGNVDRPNRPDNDDRPNRPGNVDRPNNRPNRPGNVNRPTRPGYVERPSNRPGGYHGGGDYNYNDRRDRHYHNGHYVAPPSRPYRPHGRPIPRPVPPPYYRPYTAARYIDNILGLAFGVSYIVSLDYLYDHGYTVDGYDDDVVYLRNVNEMSYNWPDATLHYNIAGQLANMQFIYSTNYNNASRYDRLHRELCRYYGAPVTDSRTANSRTGVWYGAGQRNYVSLEYDMQYVNGTVRYYTILSYGY